MGGRRNWRVLQGEFLLADAPLCGCDDQKLGSHGQERVKLNLEQEVTNGTDNMLAEGGVQNAIMSISTG